MLYLIDIFYIIEIFNRNFKDELPEEELISRIEC